jgi:hypothetical protein
VAEHAAAAAPATTAAHFAPVGEEITAAVATTEGAGMAFVMFVGIPASAVPESVAVMVMVLMKSVEKHLAHAHERFRYIVIVT